MRRPNGSGSVVKLSGKRRRPYAVRIFDGIEIKPDGNGKQKYKYLGYFEKQKDALQFLEKYNSTPVTLAKPKVESNKHKFSEIYKMYIDELHQRPKKLSEHSFKIRHAGYTNLEPLHNMVFENITLEDLESAARMKSHMSPSTIGNLMTVLRGMYKTALRHKFVTEDLSALMIVDHLNENSRPHVPFSEDEVNLLWAHKDEFYPQIALILIYTGMRVSELLQIKSENVHLNERYMIGGIKTDAGRNRTIPIAEKIVPFLDTSHEYLITKNGENLIYKKAWDGFSVAMKNLGMTHTFHDTRHTCASLMDKAKITPLHQKLILGHSVGDITHHYTHVDIKDLIHDINQI